MKICILSDFHLGHRNVKVATYKNIIKTVQENYNIDLFIDCGDLIDSNTINSIVAEDLYNIFVDINVPFYIIRGNHDSLNNISVSQLLSFNKNIVVVNDVLFKQINNITLLFVPYIDDKKELNHKLSEIIRKENNQKVADFAFSHLNVTNNIYATIPMNEIKQLYLFAKTWFNGHIHTPENSSSIYGKFFNVGSVSSLTYGDEHIPVYYVLDTETKEIKKFEIEHSLIHKTVNFDFDFDTYYKQDTTHQINWRIKIPNTDYHVNLRQQLRDKLKANKQTNNIQFDYIKTEIQNNNNIDNYSNIILETKKSLMEQLIKQFEKDTASILFNDIKIDLLNN